MDYNKMSVEEIYSHFCSVSRQRVSQIIQLHTHRCDAAVAKMLEAREMMKERKFYEKYGCGREAVRYAQKLWGGIEGRCGKVAAYLDVTNAFNSMEELLQWGQAQVGFLKDGFEIDKDLLIKGNRVYSPDTCVFIPYEINSALGGTHSFARRGAEPLGVCYNKGSKTYVAQMHYFNTKQYLGSFRTSSEAFQCYKIRKEAYLKELAELYKNEIDSRAFDALMEYKVEITD